MHEVYVWVRFDLQLSNIRRPGILDEGLTTCTRSDDVVCNHPARVRAEKARHGSPTGILDTQPLSLHTQTFDVETAASFGALSMSTDRSERSGQGASGFDYNEAVTMVKV